MGFLIFGLFRLMWLMVKLSIWLVWAMIALTVSLIALATGNERTARKWQRSMRWPDLF